MHILYTIYTLTIYILFPSHNQFVCALYIYIYILYIIIPPVLWATGGLGLVSVLFPPILSSSTSNLVLEEWFTPPPTSPGSKIVVPRAAVVTYMRLFRYPGHHHFFIIFPTPFYIDFGSILDPNLEGKSLQNRIWTLFFSVCSCILRFS